jgi:uncharacterized metal-binding protein YceD (DUF177 family)
MTDATAKRFYSFEDVKKDELVFQWEMPSELVVDLVAELDLIELRNAVLAGRFVLRKHGRVLKLQAKLSATVIQACGVTLEPIRTKVTEELDLLFSREKDIDRWNLENGPEIIVTLEDKDPPEVVGPEGADLFEVFREQLALAIPAFPRKADFESNDAVFASAGDHLVEKVKPNPFAVLAGLTDLGKKDKDSK